MEPRIQYAKTSDGISIAFWEMGEGQPIIYLPPLPQNLQMDWQLPHLQAFYEWLATGRRLIRFDARNTGLSQRGVGDLSLEAAQSDIAVVADRLGLDLFDLFVHGTSAAPGIAFAALHDERVRRLVVFNAALRFPEIDFPPPIQALRLVLDYDWETYTEMVAGIVWGWSAGEQAHRNAELFRESITSDDFKRRLDTPADLTPLLPKVIAPTLIIHHMQAVATTIEIGRRLATDIPHSRLVALEGRRVGGTFDDPRFVAAVEEFLAEEQGVPGARTQSDSRDGPSGMTAILFADIADSTGLTERLGDAAFREKARDLDGALRGVIREHAGTPIEGKLLGDGVLAVFRSARQAIEAALACASAGNRAGLPLHLGLHAGDVIREGNNVYGGAVNVAARISGLSARGRCWCRRRCARWRARRRACGSRTGGSNASKASGSRCGCGLWSANLGANKRMSAVRARVACCVAGARSFASTPLPPTPPRSLRMTA